MHLYLNYKLWYILVSCVITLSNSSFAGSDEIRKNGDILYISNRVIIKLKDFPTLLADGSAVLPSGLQTFLEQLQVNKVTAIFPSKTNSRSGSLGKILIVSYENEIDPYYLSSKLNNFNEVEWAEPKFLYELDFDPNDPSYSSQWNLSKILGFAGMGYNPGRYFGYNWNCRYRCGLGSSRFECYIWINWDEIPANGVDDDLNGFIDDIRGWDFDGFTGIPDNDPMTKKMILTK